MVDTTQVILTRTIGHAVLIIHQYHNVHIFIIQDTVALDQVIFVYNIAIGAVPQQ